ncbi:MAG: FecR domain-containing protein [Phycisphaerae bacterium]|nr:FecR domain-containing protein [Phycisphaerae bacterium]
MSADPFRHSLVHVFLEEELGNQSPPDLSQAILSQAFGDAPGGVVSGRSVGRWAWPRWSAVAAVAAVLVLGLTIWLIVSAGYPGLTISGDYKIDSGDTLRRGSTIRTQAGSAVLELGGYCRVDIKPWTTLSIDGSNYSEELFVEVGMAVCSIDSDVGRFAVLSELGSARVRGTKFTVRVEEMGGRRQMWVKVDAGSVEVSGASVHDILLAGQERTIIAGESKQPKVAAATKPDTGVEIDLGDPGRNPEFTSSSDNEETKLREKIHAAERLIEKFEAEIRELREENRRFQKELDARRTPLDNNEDKPVERESVNHE